jgi:c-di-GMP-binding flagellar brake protein YcgR
MESDRRENPRTAAKGLKAKIIITHSNRSIMIADVNLLDVSRTGIKLRVQKPLAVDLGTKVQLEIILSESGLPVILDAEVVHEKFESEFGLHYIDVKPEDPLTELIAECEHRLSWAE